MTTRSRIARRLGALAVALGAFAVGVCGAEETPLTLEDVVRAYVDGASEESLIRRIQTSDVDFDLAEDMLEELRIAGIPENVIAAMQARQEKLHPVRVAPAAPLAPPTARLVLQLNGGSEARGDDPPPVLRVLDALDPVLAARLGVRGEDRTIEDLAVVLLCRTADHVPDQWRAKSPLGRDFNAPRHRILAFLAGATAEPPGALRKKLAKLGKVPGERESVPEMQVLTLEIPDDLSAEIEPGVAHDLTLGVAVRVGERSYLVAAAERDAVVIAEAGDTRIEAALRPGPSGAVAGIEIDFAEPD